MAVFKLSKVACLLILLNGAWMAFDGVHALAAGDYVTPSDGQYAGQLGPWARLLSGVGIAPRSNAVKAAFVLLGLSSALGSGWVFLRRREGGRKLLAGLAVTQLWYVPTGTVAGVIALIAVLVPQRIPSSSFRDHEEQPDD